MSARAKNTIAHTVQGFRNRKTIIVGEVNTGKTAWLGEILRHFLEEGETDLAVIDMAPESAHGVGGKMNTREFSSIRYYTAEIVAPRLVGRTFSEIETLARHNVNLIDQILAEYLKNPCSVLLINDVSIYLQAGALSKILLLLKSTPTVIMNGYFGFSLGGGKLGKRERQNMKALQERCNEVLKC